ncbi:serine/threonine-protein kinase STY17 [Pelomyxa schiedti]|nr:serine/threonine-protein kinase STY17 [Pelomyxa schiedti]
MMIGMRTGTTALVVASALVLACAWAAAANPPPLLSHNHFPPTGYSHRVSTTAFSSDAAYSANLLGRGQVGASPGAWCDLRTQYTAYDYYCCKGDDYCPSTGEWVQVEYIDDPPWKFTQMCVELWWGTGAHNYSTIQIKLYQDAGGMPDSKPYTTMDYNLTGWGDDVVVLLDLSSFDFIAWSRTVFIGFSAFYCDTISNFVAVPVDVTPMSKITTSYVRYNASAPWEPLYSHSRDGYVMKNVKLRTTGAHVDLVPPTWTCPDYWWNNGTECNCGCGIYDLDCYNQRLPVSGCPSSLDHDCLWNGTCTELPGQCTRCNYGTQDGCQCGELSCGAIDPDCNLAEQPVYGCPDLGWSCNNQSQCEAPRSWLCGNASYFDDKCDCLCGIPDPVCDDNQYLSGDCPSGFLCKDGLCVVPGWNCWAWSYNASDGCDCSCGLFDPDCNCTRSEECDPYITGCNASQICTSNATCAKRGICGNMYIEDTEECDGGFGCSGNCSCLPGYYPQVGAGPYAIDCFTKCGDGIAVDPEECDSGKFCTTNCFCETGYHPYTTPEVSCGPACNNSIVDPYEQCDGGSGCTTKCECNLFWMSTTPISNDCKLNIVGPSIALILTLFALFGVLAGTVVIMRYYYKKKNGYQLIGGSETVSEMCKFAWTSDAHGLIFSKQTINFGTEDKLLSVEKESHDEISITNTLRSTRTLSLSGPQGNNSHKYTFLIDPESRSLSKGETCSFRFSICPKCTSDLSFEVVLKCSDLPFNIIIPVAASVEQSLKLDADEINYGEKIGQGATGSVFRAKWRGFDVAVKTFPPWFFAADTARESLLHEIDMSVMLRSPFTVTFYGFCLTRDHCLIVMEMVEMGSLEGILSHQTLSQEMKLCLCVEIAQGMQFLHRNRVIHRDLKPANVLISSLSPSASQHIKLSDFGTARIATDVSESAKYTACIGTLAFTAPEVLKSQPYSWKADVFSFGILVWCILTQQEPYADITSAFALIEHVCNGNRPPVPSEAPSSVCAVMCKCWSQNPDDRPNFSEIVSILEPHIDSERLQEAGKVN